MAIKGVKERWAENFENVLNCDRVIGKDIQKNGRVCDTLDFEGRLIFLKGISDSTNCLKKDKAPGTDSVVNEFRFLMWWL